MRCSWARDLFSAIDGTKTLGNRILAAVERMTVRRADKASASVTELYHGWSLGDHVASPQALSEKEKS